MIHRAALDMQSVGQNLLFHLLTQLGFVGEPSIGSIAAQQQPREYQSQSLGVNLRFTPDSADSMQKGTRILPSNCSGCGSFTRVTA